MNYMGLEDQQFAEAAAISETPVAQTSPSWTVHVPFGSVVVCTALATVLSFGSVETARPATRQSAGAVGA